MSKMKLETLTLLHIGSGNVLQKDCDFVCGKDEEDNPVVGVIDPRKVLALIGEENVGAWTVGIENGRGTDDIVRQHAPKSEIADYTRHITKSYLSHSPQQIKAFIRDGFGRPYIPGSSIKGAIRTAVLADIAAKNREPGVSLMEAKDVKTLEANVFGRNPGNDVFRNLLVGDAFVAGDSIIVRNIVNIVDRKNDGFWNTDTAMATEVMPGEKATEFSLVLKHPVQRPDKMPSAPHAFSTIETLLGVINNHTRKLLANEIKIWESKNVDAESKDKVENYISQLRRLLQTADGCKGTRSAVIRIGHGSGKRFVTGALTEHPRDMHSYPKSRRLEESYCEPLGFVKLTLTE